MVVIVINVMWKYRGLHQMVGVVNVLDAQWKKLLVDLSWGLSLKMKKMMSKITGRLEGWYLSDCLDEGYYLNGFIHEDSKGRWPDGTFIHTSTFPRRECEEGDVIMTRYSSYLLGKPMGRIIADSLSQCGGKV